VRHLEVTGAEHGQNDETYPDALNHRGNKTEHDVCGAAYARAAMFPASGGRRMEIAVLYGEQNQKGAEEAVFDKRSGGLSRTAGRA
jgi:hypothetical protein